MTPPRKPAKTKDMGRRKQFDGTLFTRCSIQTKQGIEAVLEPGENESDFVRIAVEKEIRRRANLRQRQGRPLNPVDEPSC